MTHMSQLRYDSTVSSLTLFYSLYCREGIFSETRMQPGESLCVGTGAKAHSRSGGVCNTTPTSSSCAEISVGSSTEGPARCSRLCDVMHADEPTSNHRFTVKEAAQRLNVSEAAI